jgi:excisionase family DNA binding protein
MDKLLLRVDEAAELIGLGRTKTYELVASGQLPAVHIGKAVRVATSAIEEFVRRLQADTRSPNNDTEARS